MSNFRAFSSTTFPGKSSKVELYWVHGCDGDIHVDQIDKIYRDDAGEVEYAENFGHQVIGVCDDTCGSENRGGFIFP